jgi:hypothetical protein
MKKETLEKLADIQHKIWSHWMRYMFSIGEFETDSGKWTMPEEKAERWIRQLRTEYKDLSEQEKESDRQVVREFLSSIIEDFEEEIHDLIRML